MNKSNNILSWLCSGFTTLLGVASTEEVMRIILLVLGVISAIVSLLYNLYLWYRKAKDDGKVTKEEIDEAVDIIKNGVDDIESKIKKNEEVEQVKYKDIESKIAQSTNFEKAKELDTIQKED